MGNAGPMMAIAAAVLAAAATADAQVVVDRARVTLDFQTYTGAGLAVRPGPGQLDADDWRVTGLGDAPDAAFGEDHASPGFARGASAGGQSAPGLYAFQVAPGDSAFGLQPGGSDFTPGSVTLRAVNRTGAAIADLRVRFGFWASNDQDQSTTWATSWSLDDVTYQPVGPMLATDGPLASAPAWTETVVDQLIADAAIPDGAIFYLRFDSDDGGATGARDEIAIDDLALIVAGCGDGEVTPPEACDDGNTADGDGCAATCAVEDGWGCAGAPSVCAPVCGDGRLVDGETCDDGDVAPGDGCAADCRVEDGWTCDGAPSVCAPVCGDGTLVDGEACDDGDLDPGDGCSAACTVEDGYRCSGQPSTCAPICGDGAVLTGEGCDDGGSAPGDGCSATCTVEDGWICTGAPSTCSPAAACGDRHVDPGEACDDGNTVDGDGCSAMCAIEPRCGDSAIDRGETCDDGNAAAGDGCSAACTVEPGYLCDGR